MHQIPYVHRLKSLFKEGDRRRAPEHGEGGKILLEYEKMPCRCKIKLVLAPGECVFGAASSDPYLVKTWIWYIWEEHVCGGLFKEE